MKVTSTVDGKTVTKYVAVKPVTYYTVTIDNNSAKAVKVTMGSETKIVAATSGTYTFTAKVQAGSNFDVSYMVDGNAAATVTVSGMTNGTSATFGGVVSIEGVDGNVTITLA